MKSSVASTGVRRLPSSISLTAIFGIVQLVSGCVSAVDDTSAFGYGPNPPSAKQLKAVAANPDDPAPTPPKAAAADETAVSAADTARLADAASPADTTHKATNGLLLKPASNKGASFATGTPTIAAFAGSGVLKSSQTDQPAADASNAGGTMFASLYAQSKAKTPIRNADVGRTHRVILPRQGAPVPVEGSVLPGVRNNASLFEIGQKASADYDADILDEASGEEGTYQTASISGLARLAPNGLLVQRPDVQTSCFQPDLVSIIRAIETRFHTKIVVTSGYRSPNHNLRVSGAKRSMHLQCKAADIIVPGADKFAVANFVRSLPKRGGVGTYCHTVAVHVDTGRQRDWNWACGRNRKNDAAVLLASQKITPRSSSD